MVKKDEIEEISRSSSAQRNKLWDMVEQLRNQYDAELKANPDMDPFESPAAQALKALTCMVFAHMSAQFAKEWAQDRAKMIQTHRIADIKKAHKPSMKVIGTIFGQFLSALGGIGFGAAPYFMATSGNKSRVFNGLSQGLFAGGSINQSIGGLFTTKQQGEGALASSALQADQQIQNNELNEQQTQARITQTTADARLQEEKARHDVFQGMANG